ncbi:MAG: type II toxin-antitoxin system RelB/DinJ family antitoxin [Eubacterium sp.]|nr:type II toxin-antitoxin system RelB/DinJ family antitoxin [Eubacterium sp.]
MSTISTRIDEDTKKEAEVVADEIGITLSTAISIFLKQFVANNGFPFEVIAPKRDKESVINLQFLDSAVKKAVANPNNPTKPKTLTYIDPKTNELTIINSKE